MDNSEYKIEGSEAAAKKLYYAFAFIALWPIAHYFMRFVIIDCSLEHSTCSKEQIYSILYFQTAAPLPTILFFAYIGYYSLKVLIHKRIPPRGHNFPYTINRVIYRDHYTFGIAGIVISLCLIYGYIDYVYFIIKITSI